MEKMGDLAKKLATLLAIELVVPGGTLVVLALLLTGTAPGGLAARLGALLPASIAPRRPGRAGTR